MIGSPAFSGIDEQETALAVPLSPARIYVNIFVALLATILFLELPNYFFTSISPDLLPKYFYYVLIALSGPVYYFHRDRIAPYLLSGFSLWLMAFIVLNLLHLLATSDSRTEPLISSYLLMLVAVFVVCFALFVADSGYLRQVFFVVGLLMALTVILDYFVPGRILPNDLLAVTDGIRGRAQGMGRTGDGEVEKGDCEPRLAGLSRVV